MKLEPGQVYQRRRGGPVEVLSRKVWRSYAVPGERVAWIVARELATGRTWEQREGAFLKTLKPTGVSSP